MGLLAILGFMSVGWGAEPEDKAGVLRTVSEVKRLSREQAIRSQPVRVNAMVTHWNPMTLDLFVQDETDGIFVAALTPLMPVAVGEWMEIEGVTSPGAYNRVISRPVFRTSTRSQAALSPKITGLDEILSGRDDARWLEVHGVIQWAVVEGGSLICWLRSSGQKVEIRFARIPPDLKPVNLLDAEVRVRAVCSTTMQASGELEGVILLANDFRDLTILMQPTEPRLSRVSRQPVASLLALRTNQFPDHAVCVRGRLEPALEEGCWRLTDSTGQILVATNAMHRARMGFETEVAGFLGWLESRPVLEDAILRQYATLEGGAAQEVQVITDMETLRTLPPDEAERAWPVYLRGIVTVVDPAEEQFCLQDASGGGFIVLPREHSAIAAGQEVEVEGFTSRGTFLPAVVQTSVKVLGQGVLPDPIFLTHGDLLSGVYDGQWIAVEGIVRRVWEDPHYLWIRLGVSDKRVDARMPGGRASGDTAGWLDAKVRITGTLDVEPNVRRQPARFQLLVPGIQQITNVRPSPSTEPPLRKIQGLMETAQTTRYGHRFRVRGVVTGVLEELGILIRDESASICVKTADRFPKGISVGEEVEVVGFPGRGDYSERIEDATIRKLRVAAVPLPKRTSAASAAGGHHDFELIQVEGVVVSDYPRDGGRVIILQSGDQLFEAWHAGPLTGSSGRDISRGFLMKLTGICLTEVDTLGEPRGFRLLLRSPDDWVVLRRPSWWTAGRILWLLGIAVGMSLAALAWVAALRRQVRERTAETQNALAFLETSIAESPSGVLIADAPGVHVRWANPAALTMLGESGGAPAENKLDRHISQWQILRSDASPYAAADVPLARAIRTGEVTRNEEFVIRNAQGENRWFTANAAPIRDREGCITAGIMVFHDVTDHKRAEQDKEKLQAQLLQSQKIESVGRLAGGVAHDFNNMLQAILGNAALAMEQVPAGSQLHEDLIEIQKAAERSADLTRQLLAFARKQTASPKILDLNQTIAGTLKMLQRLIGENIELVWCPGPGLWPVFMDSTQLDQVLANLIVNARDAITGVGKVTMQTANVTFDSAYAQTHADCQAGDYVMLAISDSGAGMDKDVLAHLFEPFFTTKGVKRGTGLGLATVYGVVKQNGGMISVYSEVGRGTTFKVYLPRIEAEAVVYPPNKEQRDLRGTETVLLVEDEEQILKLGQRVLLQQGYKVLAAHSPEEALSLVEQYPEPIDLMITDVIMPGMNGKELHEKMVATRASAMKCLFMSGYTANVIAHHGVLDDGVFFLQKPFTVQTLAEKVRDVLDAT
ncbi:MAG TPA: ATP-binding protein [Candidatus Paceibacterota bacterium]|nr:ATP-binding protein [Verrucomicrobiota bacterium]HRY46997.1 ATP-binding protein [Candidatus Paceibacterota bacterium]